MSNITPARIDFRNHYPVHVFVSPGCFQPYAIIGRTTLQDVRQLAEHYLAGLRPAQRLQCRLRVIDPVTASEVANGHWCHGRLWLTSFPDPVRKDSAWNHSMVLAARIDDLLSAIAAALLSQGFMQTAPLWLEKAIAIDQARVLLERLGSTEQMKPDATHAQLAFCQMDGILRFQINAQWCQTKARLTARHIRISEVLAFLAVPEPLVDETRAVQAALATLGTRVRNEAAQIPAFLCKV